MAVKLQLTQVCMSPCLFHFCQTLLAPLLYLAWLSHSNTLSQHVSHKRTVQIRCLCKIGVPNVPSSYSSSSSYRERCRFHIFGRIVILYGTRPIYKVSQEEWTKLRDSFPYVKLYRYNLKHLYPKLKGYGDNGQRSLKLWHLLLTYWLPNTYWNWQEYVVSVMLITVLNIKVTCEWHKAIKLNYKNTYTTDVFVLRFPSTLHRPQLTVIVWCQSYRALKHSPRSLHYDVSLPSMRSGRIWRHGRSTECGPPQKPTLFDGHYLRNRSTLDIGVLGYISIF